MESMVEERRRCSRGRWQDASCLNKSEEPVGGERGSASGAGAEISDGQLVAGPIGRGGEAGRQEIDIETEVSGAIVDLLFGGRQEVDQERGQGCIAEVVGDEAISWAVAAAAVAV